MSGLAAAPAAPSRADRARLGAHALVTCAVLATFARALPYALQARWDDGRFILENPLVREPSWRAFAEIATTPQLEAFHPLHLLSYWIDAPWALRAFSHDPHALGLVLHGTQLALYALAANALLRVMLGLGLSLPFATLATLATALHPLQVEVVSWATGRKDVLALLFVSLAWLAHLASAARTGRDATRAAWASRALYVCAALSKTTALPWPLAALIADVALARKPLRQALRTHAPALGLGALLGVLVLVIWRDSAMIRGTEGALAQAPLRVVSTLGHQLTTALWPSALSPMYATHGTGVPSAQAWLVCALFIASALLAVRAGALSVLAGLGVFAVLLLPVCNAVPMYFPWQDRYASLPSIGLAYALGALLESAQTAPRKRSAFPLVLGCTCVLALAARSVQYQGEWQSELRLWGHAAQTQPDAFYAWMKLGELRREAGELGGSEAAYARAVQVEPSRKLAHAAWLQARALRDERAGAAAQRGSLAERYAAEYFSALDDAARLRALASQMLATGHVRALELPLSRALQLDPVADDVLERAASLQHARGQLGIARVYVAQMRHPPSAPELKALWQALAPTQAPPRAAATEP